MSLRDVLNIATRSPLREYIISGALLFALAIHFLSGGAPLLILGSAILGTIVPFFQTIDAIRRRTITIEAFNFFALLVCYITGEYVSAVFIALMLAFASYLDWRTESRAGNAVEELLKLKPDTARREKNGIIEEVSANAVAVGDIVVVEMGARVPCDGVLVFGDGLMNEAPLSGESAPVRKAIGDEVYSSTLSEGGAIKIKVTRVGEDSTIAKMARLIESAGKNKSKAERLADRFAGLFLPVVLIFGAVVYWLTRDITLVAGLFLVVCADDIAVSIPLAMSASIGQSAKRGVIVKGGEWLSAMGNISTIVFDKTGTLTRGQFSVDDIRIEGGYSEHLFWSLVGSAEKYSEHPVGRALARHSRELVGDSPDPKEMKVILGAGVFARVGEDIIAIGNSLILKEHSGALPPNGADFFLDNPAHEGKTVVRVFINRTYAGYITISDTPRPEAGECVAKLGELGVRVVMLTGDNESVARAISSRLGISDVRAHMTPEGKIRELEKLLQGGSIAMVGDGINDAPALARADVGIAMGGGGTAVAVEAGNLVILSDDLLRIPEMIRLSRKTNAVIYGDMAIWFITNAVGIALVMTGFLGPALAALYNFLTDFLPLLNSARLFRGGPQREALRR